MNNIDKIFKDRTKEITFLELKAGSNLVINDLNIQGGIPLPVITDNFIKDIQVGELSEEINLGQVVEGIIFLLGVDSDFPYIEKYKEIIYAYNPKIEDYVFYKGMKALEDGEFENSGIYFRAIIELNPRNLNARLNYGLVLESIGKRYFDDEKIDEGEELLMQSSKELETIFDIDDKYSLAYYKLGYHYKYFGQILKAQITWNKFLLLDKDENRLQEIREEIDIIDDDVKIEIGLSYLTYNDFGKAIDSFLKLIPKHKDNWNVNYLIGLSYKGLEKYDMAIEYLNMAIELNNQEADIYNELGIIYFTEGNILEAIKVFNEGINETNEDYKLYFNRGLGYVQLGEYNLALADITIAHDLNPSDESILRQKEEIENYLKSI